MQELILYVRCKKSPFAEEQVKLACDQSHAKRLGFEESGLNIQLETGQVWDFFLTLTELGVVVEEVRTIAEIETR